MKNSKHGMMFRIASLFMIFFVLIIIETGYSTYYHQEKVYRELLQDRTEKMGRYLASLLEMDQENFIVYLDYFMDHYDEMDVPIDFDNIDDAWIEYDEEMLEHHPNMTLGSNISFDELDDDVKKAFAIYNHEYFLLEFEKAAESLGLEYTYFVVPVGDSIEMTYVLDAVREPRKDNSDYIDLGITVAEPLNLHEKMWEAWNTGKTPVGYDIYDNEYGKTYAYYTPLIIDGKKLGVIGTEISINVTNNKLIVYTLHQVGWIVLITLLSGLVLLWVVRKFYISKIVKLSKFVSDYTDTKDARMAHVIKAANSGDDEVSLLADQTADMIIDLDDNMKKLNATIDELKDTKRKEAVMRELANKDALTGIPNNTAYENEIAVLEEDFAAGGTKFGFVMIDLNYLKKINDTYGHENGNIAIKKLSRLICDIFTHSPVFRIGGDEFVVIIRNRDLRDIKFLVEKFNAFLDDIKRDAFLDPWERIEAAIGYAIYDEKIDKGDIDNVFKRADEAMYKRKKEMKAVRND